MRIIIRSQSKRFEKGSLSINLCNRSNHHGDTSNQTGNTTYFMQHIMQNIYVITTGDKSVKFYIIFCFLLTHFLTKISSI